MGRQVNRSELAETFGKSLPTVSAWVKSGCPVVERGRQGREWVFDTADVADWLEQRAVAAVEGQSVLMDIEEARRRKLVAEAVMAEADADQRLAKLILVEDAEELFGAECATVRTRLLALPSNWAPAVHRCKTVAEVYSILEKAVIEALEDLSIDDPGTMAELAQQAAEAMV